MINYSTAPASFGAWISWSLVFLYPQVFESLCFSWIALQNPILSNLWIKEVSCAMVFFFLSLRESQHGGRIEPDIPSSSSSVGLLPSSGITTKAPPRWQDSEFRDYITTWDTSDKAALFRRLICMLALVLHVPINVVSIMSYGISFWMFAGIVLSVLNLFCMGFALWKLDIMRGHRIFFNKMWVSALLGLFWWEDEMWNWIWSADF